MQELRRPTDLLEREPELAALEAVLAAARQGTGGLALVEGPPGIGKTSLIAAARERAAREGMRVLHGRGSELERDFPMGLVRQCLEPAVRREQDRARLLAGTAALAGPVLLGAGGDAGAPPVGILHGLHWLVANLAEEAPVLIAIDDVQWADEPSLRFVGYLARRAESLPVAVVLGMRQQEGEESAALAAIRSEPARVRLEPAALTAEAVERLLREEAAGPVDASFARACLEATRGNPFLLGELARALRVEGVPFTAGSASRVTEITPPGVARAVNARLAAMGPAATALARAAAILGDGSPLDLAAELAGQPIAESATAAAALTRGGILEEADDLRFRHPLLLGAVGAGIGIHERPLEHARAARLLRFRGAAPERIALQLLHAAPAGDEQAVGELRTAAGNARERGAPGTAVALLRRALREPPPAGQRPGLLIELARVELSAGATADAAAHLDEAWRCSTDPLTRALALSHLQIARAGDSRKRREFVERVQQVLPEVAPRDPELALRLRALVVLEDRDAEPTPPPGDTPGEAVLLGHLVFARMGRDAVADDVAELAERASRHADALLEQGASSLGFTGIVLGLRWSDRLDRAEQLLERAIAFARRRGSTTDYAAAITMRAAVHHRAGRLREAEADARMALDAALEPEWSFARGVAPLIGSLIDQGRVEEARAELELVGLAGEMADTPPMLPPLLARMRMHAARRDDARALADWEEAVRRAPSGINAGWIEDLVVAAAVHARRGDRSAAAELAAEGVTLARAWGTAAGIGQALHAQARLSEGDDALELLREAVACLAEGPARLQHARALVDLGALLRRRGARSDSREPLREGLELARVCGAAPVAETARAELRASGIRVRREALSGAQSLTPSEERICQAAAGGMANAEIAQHLFLTVKTVEMHLTNAYRKLGVRGRPELASALAAKPQGQGPGSAT